MTKKHYNFFYLLLIYLFINSALLVKILYEVHHNQTSLYDIKEVIYSSFVTNLLFLSLTIIHMIFKFKSAKKTSKEELHQKSILQSNQLQTILDKIRVGIIITDSSGIIKFANAQAANITEFPLEEMQQKHYSKIFTLLHSDKEKSSRFIIEKAMDSHCVISNKLPRTIICKNNQKKEILCTANPVIEKDNQLEWVILSFLDVTDDFAKIVNISQENKLLNEALLRAELCYFRKNLQSNKISGSDNLSSFRYFHSDNTEVADEEWLYPDDLDYYRNSIKNFLAGNEDTLELFYRSNYYSDLRFFRQIICKDKEPNFVSGIIQEIGSFAKFDKNLQHNQVAEVAHYPQTCTTAPTQKKLSILIVDYEINNCNVLALTFTKLNYTVRVTTTPNSALEYLKNCKVDIVLANLELPNMNAIEFAKEIRHLYGFDMMIYVILDDASIREKLNLHIFNGILIKPITLEQIKEIF